MGVSATDSGMDWEGIIHASVYDSREDDLFDEYAPLRGFYGYTSLDLEKVVAYGELGRALFELFAPLHGEKLDE